MRRGHGHIRKVGRAPKLGSTPVAVYGAVRRPALSSTGGVPGAAREPVLVPAPPGAKSWLVGGRRAYPPRWWPWPAIPVAQPRSWTDHAGVMHDGGVMWFETTRPVSSSERDPPRRLWRLPIGFATCPVQYAGDQRDSRPVRRSGTYRYHHVAQLLRSGRTASTRVIVAPGVLRCGTDPRKAALAGVGAAP